MTQQTEPAAEGHHDPLGSSNDRNGDGAGPDLATAITNAAQHIGRRLDNLAREVALLINAVENQDLNVDVVTLGSEPPGGG